MNKFIVSAEEKNKRLDAALFAHGAGESRSQCQRLIKEGKVFVNGKNENAHYPLREGDEVSYEDYQKPSTEVKGEDIPLDIVYEDEDILIINKPAGLVVHPGNGHKEGTLVNGLVYRDMNLSPSSSPERPGLVHRIDKDTSGLLAIAKSDRAFASLSAQLSTHSMHREYIALVQGIILEDDGKIDAPIARDPAHPTRNKVDVMKGKEAVTFFHVQKRYPESKMTLISCRLLTGRTHQIRVHMEYIHHPVMGDPLYGKGNRSIAHEGQLLHAYRLTFVHPATEKEVSFEAPLPAYFQTILNELK